MTKLNSSELDITNNKVLLIPFSKLHISKKNVRTIDTNKSEDEELLNSIKSVGLLNNLVVVESKKGTYEVIAGQRRFSAIKKLVKENFLDKDFKVYCKVVNDNIATLSSFSENFHRSEMSIYDTFIAVNTLKNEGKTIDEIALLISKPKSNVKQYLSLANVHPDILQLFNDGSIDYDCIKAFTLANDQKRQLEALNYCKDHITNWKIRNYLLNEKTDSSSSLAKFVGLDAYIKEGGTTTPDLFAKKEYLNNIDILLKLGEEKLNREKSDLEKENWAWIETCLENKSFHEFESTPTIPLPVPAKLEKKLENKQNLFSEHDEKWNIAIQNAEDKGTELTEKQSDDFQKKYDKLSDEINEIEEKINSYFKYDEIAIPYSGCCIYVVNGELHIKRGLMKSSDLNKYKKLLANENQSDKEVTIDDALADSGISQTLKEILYAEDRQLWQLACLKNPLIAFDAISFEQCYSILSERKAYDWTQCFSFNISDKINTSPELISTKAHIEIEKICGPINKSWIKPDSVVESFIAFCELPQNEKIELVGICASHSGIAEANFMSNEQKCIYREVLRKTKFVKSDHWQATDNRYFKKMNLKQLQNVASEVLSTEWVVDKLSLSKKDFVNKISHAFKSKSNKDKNIQNSIDNYLPNIMK